ncbi:hypothetical protein [Lysobacter tyrosinilyticus]
MTRLLEAAQLLRHPGECRDPALDVACPVFRRPQNSIKLDPGIRRDDDDNKT